MVGTDVTIPAPVTNPVISTVAWAVLLLLQVPPPDDDDNGVLSPIQTDVLPVIADGTGFTVTSLVVEQPVDPKVKVIVDVPADNPDTLLVKPGEVTPATLVVPLLQVPVPPDPVNTVVEPTHTSKLPVIADGVVFTVTTLVAKLVQPEPLVTL